MLDNEFIVLIVDGDGPEEFMTLWPRSFGTDALLLRKMSRHATRGGKLFFICEKVIKYAFYPNIAPKSFSTTMIPIPQRKR